MTQQEIRERLICIRDALDSSVDILTQDARLKPIVVLSRLRNATALAEVLLEEFTESLEVVVPAQEPVFGQTVKYIQGDEDSPFAGSSCEWRGINGSREHPAIVTKINEDGSVNLVVFIDTQGPIVVTNTSKEKWRFIE